MKEIIWSQMVVIEMINQTSEQSVQMMPYYIVINNFNGWLTDNHIHMHLATCVT